MTKRLFTLLLGLALLAASSAAASPASSPQGSKADYERAAALRSRFRNLVHRDAPSVQWLGANKLWYAVRTDATNKDLVVVDLDAPEGARRRVLATFTALAAAVGRPDEDVDVARLQWNGGSSIEILLTEGHGAWRVDVDAGTATALEPESVETWRLPARRLGGRSRRVRDRSAIYFVNRTDAPIELEWVNVQRARESYGTLEPGEARWMSTSRTHVWAALDQAGDELAFFIAEREAGVALVDGSKPEEFIPEAERPSREERRRAGNPATGRRYQAFQRDHDVWLKDAAFGTEHRVTTDGTEGFPYEGRMYWSPDGSYLVCQKVELAEERTVHVVESSPDGQVQPKLHSFGYRKPGDRIDETHLHLFEVADDGTSRAIPIADDLFPTPWRIRAIAWETDSSRFTFLYDQRGHQVARWISVDPATGTATARIEETPQTFVDYSQKRFFQRLEGTNDVLWMSERSGWNHLYLIDALSGDVIRPLPLGEWVVRGVEEVDEEKRELLLRVMGIHSEQDPYHEHFARVRLDDGALTLLTEGDGTHELEFSPDGAHYIDTWSRVDQPRVVELRRTSDGALVTVLEAADWSALLAAGWRPPQRFVAKGRDGATDIWGVVYRPTDFDSEKRYPVIESIYAGPHDHHVPKSFRVHRKQQELAELGFVVVQIDGMGTNWRSKAFHDVAWRNIGDAGFPDRIAWMRALAATDPALDVTRVGIFGGSAGGQNALRALIAHHDFYSAAAADCGCHDNRMDKLWWNEAWMGWPLGPHYAESSNVAQAHRMEGALLLTVGELDRNVDPASTMQVVKALIEADKDFDLLVVPGAGHGVGDGPYATRRRRDFFVRHLLEVEPRWE